KSAYLDKGEPVISIDTKKKELIGNFSRDGRTYTQTPVDTLDHGFSSAGEAKLIPHGIYDLARNQGYMSLNTSHGTSEFCCDGIAHWWKQYGHQDYPNACRILVLCDGGGSNAANRHVFKETLQALAERLGLEIRVAHYPPYCSKYNPIEHRLFAHLTRACHNSWRKRRLARA
ncbi:MAG: ISAzo13 family transposase, partial [Methylobacter sp.]|nr:ISAzo13 family transposase [Methylobacter sp.]